jgi:hypothetical protein
MTECEKRLQLEREKLNRLVDEALENGTPIDRTHVIMSQCRKLRLIETGRAARALQSDAIREQSRQVDDLAVQVERERGEVI